MLDGPEIFDSDSAVDFVISQMLRIVQSIKRDIGKFDETDGDWLLAATDVLTLLAKHYAIPAIDKESAENWRASYLRNWNAYVRDLGASEDFIRQREAVINKTFDGLDEVANAKSEW